MKVLDLFCGLGGWSEGFNAEGFDCLGVDIVNVGYKYDMILCDVCGLDAKRFKGKFDVIVGSPPCRDFSKICNLGKIKWKKPPSPDNGLILVKEFLEFVTTAQPKYWILENVPGLDKYMVTEPVIKGKIARTQPRHFWGEFPQLLLPDIHRTKQVNQINGKHRSWKRAKIPTPVSRAFAKVIREENEQNTL
jgi:site-specific DNA-cytosine methylase